MGLSLQIFISMILGVALGLFCGPEYLNFINTWIAPLGTIFMRLIRMMVVPIVLSSLIAGVCSLGDTGRMGRIGLKTFVLCEATTLIALFTGILFGIIFQPGVGVNLEVAQAPLTTSQSISIRDMLTNLVPANPLVAIANGDMLPVIVFSLIMGCGIVAAKEKSRTVPAFFIGMADICYKVIGWVLKLAPIGVFGLITPVVAESGSAVLLPLIKVILAVYLGCVLHGVIVYASLLALCGFPVLGYFKNSLPASLVAFTGCSSSGTLPVTMECANRIGISQGISSFVLPLGSTVHMDGTGIYQGVCALFVAQIYGVELGFYQYCLLVFIGSLVAIGTAGIPGGAFIMLTMVLSGLGLPLEGAALVAGVDRILDMAVTCLNVTGDSIVCGIIAKSEGEKLTI